MKKLLLVILCFLILGCENEDTVVVYRTTASNEKVVINHKSYLKVEVEGHDFYFRTWSTYCGTGSDLVHNPNCKKCNNPSLRVR